MPSDAIKSVETNPNPIDPVIETTEPMTLAAITPKQDEQELLELLHITGCYEGSKSRLQRDVLREGLKAVIRKHGLSVMRSRFPDNELFAEAVASESKEGSAA